MAKSTEPEGGGRGIIDGEVAPPVLVTVEGVLKLILGFGAGVLLLWMAYQSFRAGQRIDRDLVGLLAGFVVAFFGVDVWAILKRVEKGGASDGDGSRR